MAFPLTTLLRLLSVLGLLFVFFVSIQLMGDSFKTWKAFSEILIQQTSNPFVGLLIGILATSLIQSSSTTTSMTVGFVASGVLPVSLAVPVIMGANIGTSVTNTLVAMGNMARRGDFLRAMACATVHDIFNLMGVIVLLPSEILTRWIFGKGILEGVAGYLAVGWAGMGGLTFSSPLKAITKPASHWLKDDFLGAWLVTPNLVAIGGLVLAIVMLVVSLILIVRVMRSMVLRNVEIFFDRYVGAHWTTAMGMGVVITVLVQSSSITTSLLVPMASAGVLRLAQAFPITLGANIGTTITALMASLAATGSEEAQVAAVTIAVVHLLFNLSAIALIYPMESVRRIPLELAERLARACADRRWLAFVYVATVFFLIPGILVAAWEMVP